MRASWCMRNLCLSHADFRLQSTLLVRASFVSTRACRRASTLDGQATRAPAAGPAGVLCECANSTHSFCRSKFVMRPLHFIGKYCNVTPERHICAAGRYEELEFPVVSESIVHQRYLTLFNRRIRFPAVGTRPVRSGVEAVDRCFARVQKSCSGSITLYTCQDITCSFPFYVKQLCL